MNHHPCPTCCQAVDVPTLDVLCLALNLQPLQAKILKAIWHGRGQAVPTSRIFDAMYEDDYDGGPSDVAMYKSFKVALCRLRARLEGSGISIKTVGYRAGWRILLHEGEAGA